ncbi:GNAT family N-acetyltransferase [Virgisporangium ochraceum]|nr:GNAT family N-acetyltransferase [Virgisporangium ochraceum]
MEVTVRRGTAEDAPALARLRWQWEVDEHGATPDLDEATYLENFTRWAAAHRATHVPFVAEVDGVPAGMAWLMVSDRVPAATRMHRRFGDVQSVYVVPEHRNAGIGAKLMAAVLREAGGLEFVTVHSSARAISMYRRAGFGHSARWLEVRSP